MLFATQRQEGEDFCEIHSRMTMDFSPVWFVVFCLSSMAIQATLGNGNLKCRRLFANLISERRSYRKVS
jgi:hypothetical protein